MENLETKLCKECLVEHPLVTCGVLHGGGPDRDALVEGVLVISKPDQVAARKLTLTIFAYGFATLLGDAVGANSP